MPRQTVVLEFEGVGATARGGEVAREQWQDGAQSHEAVDEIGVARRPGRGPPRGGCAAAAQAVLSASVGDRRAARMAGRIPAIAPMRIAAPMPPPQAAVGITVVQCLVCA